ncbi:MAG: hypothetical protein GX878_10480 [Firmicutes bacterium]|nr:hypothetical protein [Bacillota bacterium]
MKVVVFEAMPASLQEFYSLPQMDLTLPENTCAIFLCALNLYVQDRDVGVQAINILKGPVDLNVQEINWLRDRLMDKPYLPLAYFEGARPENSYVPVLPYTLQLYPDPRPQDCEAGYMRLYLKTTGADSPRAIKLRQKERNWYLWEYPSILTGIRTPVSEDPWG